MFYNLLKYIKLGSLIPSAFLVTFMITALILSIVPTNPEELPCKTDKEIYISSNGVHLDLIVPRESLSSNLLEGLNPAPEVSHLAFGWGDKEFYINTPTWGDLEIGTAFRALFVNSESAIHVVWISRIYPHWTKVLICDSQVHSLMEFLDNSFKRGSQSRLLEIEAAGYTVRDKFYEANGSFNCIQTCNNWVNRSLKAAQVRTSVWSPFDRGVLYQLR